MKYLVLLNGTPPAERLCKHLANEADAIICVDGALNYAHAYGIVPDIMLGDMDSVNADFLDVLAPDTKIIRHNPIKDQTDFELAIDYVAENGGTDLAVLGFFGGRIDHSLVNIAMLLYAWRKGLRIDARDANQRLTVRSGEFTVTAHKGDTFSIIPLAENIRVSLSGLFYPLDNYALRTDSSLGVSNVFTEDTATVKADGAVLIIVTEQK